MAKKFQNGLFESYGQFWKNYTNFAGRATRTEYWGAWLINAYIMLSTLMLGLVLLFAGPVGRVMFFVMLAMMVLFYGVMLIPTYAVGFRRIQDTGHSGYLYLLSLLPLINIAIMVMCMLPSSRGTNQWGKPRAVLKNHHGMRGLLGVLAAIGLGVIYIGGFVGIVAINRPKPVFSYDVIQDGVRYHGDIRREAFFLYVDGEKYDLTDYVLNNRILIQKKLIEGIKDNAVSIKPNMTQTDLTTLNMAMVAFAYSDAYSAEQTIVCRDIYPLNNYVKSFQVAFANERQKINTVLAEYIGENGVDYIAEIYKDVPVTKQIADIVNQDFENLKKSFEDEDITLYDYCVFYDENSDSLIQNQLEFYKELVKKLEKKIK